MTEQHNASPEIAIVVIAYSRLESLKRLIGSLYKADYLNDKVNLIISIDNSGTNSLIEYAKSLSWPHGDLQVIAHEQRLGLKRHVLKCGEFTSTYEYVCVLEDDLYVSPSFYSFTKSAVTHFKDFKSIAGISLYSHQWNPYTNRPFGAAEDQFDVYFLQVASSWGQVWSREGWNDFMNWMSDKTDNDLHSHLIPCAVANWSNKSWLKFHNKYLVDRDKYFLYPRQSLTTNFSDQGEHAVATTTYQVPLVLGTKRAFDFPSKLESTVKYDAFFENKELASSLGMTETDLDVNLHGIRLNKKRYILTTEVMNFKVVREFGLRVRPIDANILLNIPGSGIYLYDTLTPAKNMTSRRQAKNNRFLYDIKAEAKKEFLYASMRLYMKAVFRRLRLG